MFPRSSLLLLAGCATAPRAATGPAAPTELTATQRARDAAAAPGIAEILGAHQNDGGVLSPDGATLLFRSDRGGSSEAYLADAARPTAPARRLVPGPERVASAVFTADGVRVVFRKDRGADENFHIFAIGTDGRGAVDLTPGAPLWRDAPLLPRGRGDLMVYGARKPTDYASMAIVQDLAGGAPRVVYRESGPGTIIDVRADASHALWFREAATGGHELAEIDLATGAARAIADEPARLTAAAYATDGARIYIATDHGSEAHVVEARDRATLAVRATYRQADPPTAEVTAIVPSPRGDRVAILVDAGNRSHVRLLDAATIAVVADVALPLGSIGLGTISETRVRLGGGAFSADGARFAVAVSVPDQPDDVWLVDTATGAAHPARREPRPALAALAPSTASVAEVRAVDGLRIPVNVYLPAAAGRRPVMVWLHGGPDASSGLAWNAWNRVFTAAGYAVLEPNIRGSTGFGHAYAHADDRAGRHAALRDIEQVNAWARAQPWCDPDRLVIAGASFGGYYALMALAHQPTRWRAGVDLVGPSDLALMLSAGGLARRYAQELGDPVADAALLAALSPIHAIDRVVAPLFVYQGANDGHVPRVHADRVVHALRARGRVVEYLVASDEGHSVARRDNEVALLSRMLRFLADALR